MKTCPYHTKTKDKPKQGVLLVNLGTPEGTDYWSVRRYLAEFLNDVRVIDLPRWQWWPILYGPVLTFRPKKVGHAYATIWNKELNESPLKTTTRSQALKLQALLGQDYQVDWAMRYGKPAVKETIQRMQAEGVEHLTVVPLYPQYAGATVGSVMDAVAAAVPSLTWVPSLKTVPPYYDHPAYIDLLAGSIRKTVGDKPPEVLICSFHGLPQRFCREGDVYFCHCHKTARLLAEKLGWEFLSDWRENPQKLAQTDKPKLLLTFQSRFGPEEWLQPYTDKTFKQLGMLGIKRIAAITPGFAADCLETLEEIAIQGREEFLGGGGEDFTFVPSLNDDDGHVGLLAELVR